MKKFTFLLFLVLFTYSLKAQFIKNEGAKITIGSTSFIRGGEWSNANATSQTNLFGSLSLTQNLINNGFFLGQTNSNLNFIGISMQNVQGSNPISLYNMQINNGANHVTLQNSITISNLLSLTNGRLISETAPIFFSPTALNPIETNANRIIGTAIMQSRTIGTGNLTTFLGASFDAGADLGNVSLTRKTGIQGIIVNGTFTGIATHWSFASDNNAARNLTFNWLSDLDNGKNLTQMQLWRSTTTTAAGQWLNLNIPVDMSSRSYSYASNSLQTHWSFSDEVNPLSDIPNINLKGNGTNIASEDTSPSTTDNTDFGTACSTTTRTFVIENTGTGALNLTGTPIVAISGSTDFSISTQPSATTLGMGGSITFVVTYIPNTAGVQTATISITNNDSDENPYTFVVGGSKDTQLPVLTAQADFTRNADTGVCTFTNVASSIPNGTATDNCSVASYSYVLTGATTGTVTTLVNQVFNLGTTTVTWTATDASSNVSLSDEFTVTVNDTQLPVLTAQTDFIRNADTGVCTFTNVASSIPNGTATDNCSVASYSYVLTGATTGTVTTLANQVFNIGTTTVTWTATDASGNVSLSDEFTVTVNDTELPTAVCQNFTVQLDATGNASITAAQVDNGSSDNCGTVSLSVSPNTFTCADIGANTVTLTVIDAAGNLSDCTATVTVVSPRELDVQGNSVSIVDGDNTPSIADDTDFGSVITTETKTYTLDNTTGTEAVTITSITSDNGDFEVLVAGLTTPTTLVIPAGGTETFDVVFTPTVSTLQTAIITIENNDCDEGLYDFVVQGKKPNPVPPLPTPASPTGFTAMAISTTQINLSWNAVSNNVVEYVLYQNGIRIATLPVSTTSYQLTGLTPNSSYQYSLEAINARNGERKASVSVSAKDWTFPEVPVLLGVSEVCGSGEASVFLSSSANSYRIYDQMSGGNLLLESNNGAFSLPFVHTNTTFYAASLGVNSNKESQTRIPISVVVQPIFESKIIGEVTQFSCESSIVLEAQEVEGASYTWFRNGLEVGTGQTYEATFSSYYQVYISKGVCSFMSEKVTVKLNQVPVAKIQEINGTRFCEIGRLNAIVESSNATYQWLFNDEVIGEGTSLSISESGIYTLQVTQNGCQGSTQTEVFIFDTPSIPVLEATETTICSSTETTISVQNIQSDVTYQWFRNGRALNQTGSSISTSVQGTYQVRAFAIGNTTCSVLSENIVINYFEVRPIYLRISEDKKSLFLDIQSQDEIASVEWYFNDEMNTALGTSSQITPTEDGYYFAIITNTQGCIVKTARTVYFKVPQEDEVVIGEDDLKGDIFNIYPNPSLGTFKVHFRTVVLEDIEITIFDGIGRKVSTHTFEKGKQDFILNLNEQVKGMYMIHFKQKGSTYFKQIIIE